MKKQILLLVAISLLTLTLSNLSFLYFFLTPNQTHTFLGRHAINSEDTYTYLSFIEQSRQGRNLFENLYTTENQTPTLLRPSYLLIGKLAQITHLSSLQAYHLSRLIFSILFFIVLYIFICKIFEDKAKRLTAFFIICLSSGLATTNWIPESLTFLSLGEAPHFILSQTLMLLGFYLTLKLNLLSIIPFFLLSLEHPFNLIVVFPTILITFIWSKKGFFKGLLFACLSSLGLLYQLIETKNNPILAAWQSQNILLSPPPNDYILGFGLLTFLTILGVEAFINQSTFKHKLILSWLACSAILIYAPFPFQRRLIEGVHIPLSLLATSGLFTLAHHFKKYTSLIIILTLLILPLGSFYSIYTDFKTISHPNLHYYYFLDKDEATAITWLRSHTTSKDTILANRDYGNLLPGIIGRKTYVGHLIQTIDINRKIANINTFLLNENPLISLSFLPSNKITYIFLGKNDAMTRYGFKPDARNDLKQVYNQHGVTIYKVLPTNNSSQPQPYLY